MTWYGKHIPKVKEAKAILPEIKNDILNIDGIKNIYIWGSLVSNYNSPNSHINDIDILASTIYNSGDLIAIENECIVNSFSDLHLEKLGFNPEVIKFSKDFVSIDKYNIDHWVISSDKKLLHWGPILKSKKESQMLLEEAKIFADKNTGVKKKKINKVSQEKKLNWYNHYNTYINDFFSDMPSGWYLAEVDNINSILKKAIKLD